MDHNWDKNTDATKTISSDKHQPSLLSVSSPQSRLSFADVTYKTTRRNCLKSSETRK